MKTKSLIIWLIIVLIAMVGTITIMLGLSKIIKVNEKIQYSLFTLIFLVLYGVLMFFWTKIDKN
jgi:MFS-type transporter involved in bile tolerance (Atg22 family)